jgi:hypothetical protein
MASEVNEFETHCCFQGRWKVRLEYSGSLLSLTYLGTISTDDWGRWCLSTYVYGAEYVFVNTVEG